MKEYNLQQSDELGLYFLYVGNVYPHKNLENAIKAISLVNKNEIKINFVIVCARNVFRKKLEKLMNKLITRDFVKFLGFVDDEKLRTLYENSVGFIYPSLSEGFGLPGLEAMKAGTVLLSSDIPVFREVYGNHAIYFDPTDIQSIAKAIQKTLSLTKLEANKMIKDNKEFIKRYSWEKMAKETLEVYNSFK